MRPATTIDVTRTEARVQKFEIQKLSNNRATKNIINLFTGDGSHLTEPG
jgi:hypothetical protein